MRLFVKIDNGRDLKSAMRKMRQMTRMEADARGAFEAKRYAEALSHFVEGSGVRECWPDVTPQLEAPLKYKAKMMLGICKSQFHVAQLCSPPSHSRS